MRGAFGQSLALMALVFQALLGPSGLGAVARGAPLCSTRPATPDKPILPDTPLCAHGAVCDCRRRDPLA